MVLWLVDLYEVESASALEPISLFLKNPKMTVKGNTSIENSNLDGYLTGRDKLNTGNTFNIEGQQNQSLTYRSLPFAPINDTRINYISHLQDIMTNWNIHKYQTLVKLPGDIPYKGDEIPWKKHPHLCREHYITDITNYCEISWQLWPKIRYGEHKV